MVLKFNKFQGGITMWKYALVVIIALGFVKMTYAGYGDIPILPVEPCQPCLCEDGRLDPVLEQNIVIPQPPGCVETVCQNKGAVCLCGWTVNKPHPMGTHTEIVECKETDYGLRADCNKGYGVVIPQTECRRYCDCDVNGFPFPPGPQCETNEDCIFGECIDNICQGILD